MLAATPPPPSIGDRFEATFARDRTDIGSPASRLARSTPVGGALPSFQGAVPARASGGQSGGSSVKLVFDDKTNVANSKPFLTSKALPAAGQIVADKDRFQSNVFPSLDATKVSNRRVPDDLTPYNETKDGKGTITSAIIQNPNLVLGKALEKLEITDSSTFTELSIAYR